MAETDETPTTEALSRDEQHWAKRTAQRASTVRTVTGDEWNATTRLLDIAPLSPVQAAYAARCVENLGESEWRVRRDRDRLADEVSALTSRVEALETAVYERTSEKAALLLDLARLTEEKERLRAVAEQARTLRYTLMYVSSLLTEPVTDKNIRDAREAIAPLYQDALRDVKADRAALTHSPEPDQSRLRSLGRSFDPSRVDELTVPEATSLHRALASYGYCTRSPEVPADGR